MTNGGGAVIVRREGVAVADGGSVGRRGMGIQRARRRFSNARFSNADVL
jgi:hypothetical protein